MSTNATLLNAGQTIVGPLDVYIAPGGTREPVIDVPVVNCGAQTLVYGEAASAAGIDAAVAAEDAEVGFGAGAALRLSFTQPTANAAWVAWVAVSEDLAETPTDWAKRGTTVDKDNVTLTVYSIAGKATDESLTVDVTFGGNQVWIPLGYQESCDISESGISVSHDQSTSIVRCLGSPGPSKITRDTDDLMVSFELNDLSIDTYGAVLDRAAVRDSPNVGGVGWKQLELHRNTNMAQYALCARGTGLSSYVEGGNIQYWIPFCVQIGSQNPVYTKSAAAALAVEFQAVENRGTVPGGRYGRFTQQDRIRGA